MTDYNIVNWLKKHGKRNIADVAREMESQEAKIKELEAKVEELEKTALPQFVECGGEEIEEPIERLRFFCSLAMNSQNWLDSEPLFDALQEDKE